MRTAGPKSEVLMRTNLVKEQNAITADLQEDAVKCMLFKIKDIKSMSSCHSQDRVLMFHTRLGRPLAVDCNKTTTHLRPNYKKEKKTPSITSFHID